MQHNEQKQVSSSYGTRTPMKWYYFQLVVLPISCLLSISIGVRALKVHLSLLGVVTILLGVFTLITWILLLRKKSCAPGFVIAQYIIGGIVGLLLQPNLRTIITTLIPTIIVSCLNWTYYRNRYDIFIN